VERLDLELARHLVDRHPADLRPHQADDLAAELRLLQPVEIGGLPGAKDPPHEQHDHEDREDRVQPDVVGLEERLEAGGLDRARPGGRGGWPHRNGLQEGEERRHRRPS
jgi:hypothetical protein